MDFTGSLFREIVQLSEPNSKAETLGGFRDLYFERRHSCVALFVAPKRK